MPLMQLKEVTTPLSLFGIKFFRSVEDRKLYIKFGKGKIKKL
ncbi:hypothetical protein [Bacillus weihaiensis]|nr:hypothetical protein [Bacillus weihaiensis]